MNIKHLFLATTALLMVFSTGCSSEEESTTASSGSTSNSGSSGSSGSTGSSEETSADVSAYQTSSLANVPESTAKTVALRHAGVSEDAIEGYSCVIEDNQGMVQYNITFWQGTVEYLFYVSGADGAVLFFTTEFHQTGYQAPTEGGSGEDVVFTPKAGNLTESQSKAIVAKDAGISESSMSNFTIKEKESGSLIEYEMTFTFGSSEYYYSILATSGTITFSKVNNVYTEPLPTFDSTTTTDTFMTTTPDTSTGTTTTTPDTSTDSSTTTTPDSTTTTTPDSTTTTTPTAPNISSSEAKNIALRQTGASDSQVDRLSISENKDSSGSVTSYQVSYFYEMQQYSYTISASSGGVS